MNQHDENTADEVIGMDHPLFMASAQAGIDALFAFDAGIPLEEALPSITERLTDLFGDLPLGLVEERVRSIYNGRSA
jgi:hypothetical protein